MMVTRRLKDLGTFKTGLTYSPDYICAENEGILVLRSSNIKDGKLSYSDNVYVDIPLNEKMLVKKGDIIICSRNGSANLVGKTAVVDSDIYASWGAFMMLFRTKHNSRYLNYLLNVHITKNKGMFATSTINQLTNSMLGNIFVEFIEDANHQQKIADYLDEKTKAIDARISVLEKKSDAYTRLKASVINRAVTRGLNPNVTLKDSGIEWIGMIPEHWEVRRIKDLMKLLNGRAYLQPELQDEGKYRILRVGNFFTNDKWYYSDLELEASKYCEKGDLLFAWSASFGPFLWNEEKVIYHYHIWKVILNSQYDKQYAFQMFKAFSDAKRRDVHGSTMVHLTLQDMNQSYIPLPPLSEQQSIATYLDTKCSEIDKAIDNIGKQIEALKRLKRSLINEVVTGKRKV